jgi:hypothetical protein
VYAATEAEWKNALLAFYQVFPASSHFGKYFTNNWLGIKDMWVLYYRNNCTHIMNTTTNRIESKWRHFKPNLKNRSSLAECLRELVNYEARYVVHVRQLVQYRASTVPIGKVDPVLESIQNHCSDFVLKLCMNALSIARSKSDVWWLTDDKGFLCCHSFERQHVYIVDIENGVCTCNYYHNSLLPCRHLFYAYWGINGEVPYPITLVSRRWQFQSMESFASIVEENQCIDIDTISYEDSGYEEIWDDRDNFFFFF